MLAASGFYQPVNGVIRVFGAWFDTLIEKKDCLLGLVADVGDVAHRIVRVVQVLHLAARPAGGRRLRTIIGKGNDISPHEQ